MVGYLGDGINDTPSMKVADVSISVTNAVDIAKESADIILLRNDLKVIADGVDGRPEDLWQYHEIYSDGHQL